MRLVGANALLGTLNNMRYTNLRASLNLWKPLVEALVFTFEGETLINMELTQVSLCYLKMFLALIKDSETFYMSNSKSP